MQIDFIGHIISVLNSREIGTGGHARPLAQVPEVRHKDAGEPAHCSREQAHGERAGGILLRRVHGFLRSLEEHSYLKFYDDLSSEKKYQCFIIKMKKFFLSLSLLLFSSFAIANGIELEILKCERHDDLLEYEINIINKSDKDLLLTDICGDFYFFDNSVLYILLFAGNQFADNYFSSFYEYVMFSDSSAVLKKNSKYNLKKRLNLKGERFSRFFQSDALIDWKNVAVSDIKFQVGYMENTDFKSAEYIILNFKQKINEQISVEEFSKLPAEQEIKFIFDNLKFSSWEFESYIYCNYLARKLNSNKTPKKQKKFLEACLLDAISQDSFENGLRNHNFENAYYVFSSFNFYSNKDFFPEKTVNKIALALANKSISLYENGVIDSIKCQEFIAGSLGKRFFELFDTYMAEFEGSEDMYKNDEDNETANRDFILNFIKPTINGKYFF